MQTGNKVLAAAVAACVALPLFGGGFFFQLGSAGANPAAAAVGAVLVTRVSGCHDPAKARVTGTVESVSGGKRQSAELKLIPLEPSGTFAVKREWPADESRVLRLTASEDGLTTSVLVRMDGDSFDRANVKYLQRASGEEDVAPLLAQLR